MNWLKFGGLTALAFGLGLLLAGILDLPSSTQAQQASARRARITEVAAPSFQARDELTTLSDAFASVAEAVKPAVVLVRSQRTARAGGRTVPPGFEWFFRNPQPQEPGIEEGRGSGFIVSKDGYILTNHHVIDGAEKVTVRLADRREFVAEIVGSDPNTDVALIKIKASGLTPAALGDSDAARVGEWVLAIGNPLGETLTFTVTSGIVSAKGRGRLNLPNTGANYGIQDFIQTDAAINPGNSGGPLMNTRGEVIGINSAIASETGFNAGYGFAIPINLARNVMDQLITSGHVSRAALRVSISEVTPADAAYMGLDEIRGVKIEAFSSDDSPAKKAGLKPGDVILAIDGKQVDYVGQLQQEIGFRKPGDVVAVEVARKAGERKTVRVKLASLNEEEQVAAADAEGEQPSDATERGAPLESLGITVATISTQDAQELNLPESDRGLQVTSVTPGGPSWRSLIPNNDIIVSVEDRPVHTERDLRNALARPGPGGVVTLGVIRVGPNSMNRLVVRIKLAQ